MTKHYGFMMNSFFRCLKFIWDYFVRGKHHLPGLPDYGYPPVDVSLMEYLTAMYQNHGASAHWVDNWVIVDGGKVLTRASFTTVSINDDRVILQVDFVTCTPSGHHIVESFGGVGDDQLSALQDACENFHDATFHPLFAVLLDRPCTHVERRTWTIGGVTPRSITLGMLRIRGDMPTESWPTIFEAIQEQVESCDMQQGLHWVRYYYCRVQSEAPTVEVLIDNEPREDLQIQAAGFPWPESETFFTLRLFFIVHD